MSFLSQLAGVFSRDGRKNALLLQGLAHAKAGRPEQAISIYNSLLESSSTGSVIRARAYFNRALAYSALKDDAKAVTDLQAVLATAGLPENVQSAATAQLARVKRRTER
jgi:tetratricopeptide (TPR) repeat protein